MDSTGGGHMGHLDPFSRKVLREISTEKKIPEMTLNVPHVPPGIFKQGHDLSGPLCKIVFFICTLAGLHSAIKQ